MVEYKNERKILNHKFEEIIKVNPNNFYVVLV